MTSEERFIRIENALQTVAENQAMLETGLIQLRESQRQTDERLTGLANTVGDLANTVGGLAQSLQRLSDLQEQTELRLHTLIEHVDDAHTRLSRVEGRVGNIEKRP